MTSDNPFREKSVAVTGKLNNYTRDGIKARLTALGARPVGERYLRRGEEEKEEEKSLSGPEDQ